MHLINPRPYTHWANHTAKRLFLVLDVLDSGTVVLMEVKDYSTEEARNIQQITATDWMILTQEKAQLKLYIPRL